MSKVRVAAFAVSVDGFGAGPEQSLADPLGINGERLHDWMVPTESFQKMYGKNGAGGIDDEFAERSFDNVGAWIMGRNMFGPVRGGWPDEQWKGWWGDDPPFHVPVFVLTHHPRDSFEMEGGTTFHFVTGGIDEALERAREAAAGKDVRIGGGVSTVRQYLERRLIDELHIAVAPVLLGRGEALFDGLDFSELGYDVVEPVMGEAAMHVRIARRD